MPGRHQALFYYYIGIRPLQNSISVFLSQEVLDQFSQQNVIKEIESNCLPMEKFGIQMDI